MNCCAHIQAFAKEGAQVTATDINGEKLKELDSIPGDSQYGSIETPSGILWNKCSVNMIFICVWKTKYLIIFRNMHDGSAINTKVLNWKLQ